MIHLRTAQSNQQMKMKNNFKIQSASENNALNARHTFVTCSVLVIFLLTACAKQSPSEAWFHTSRNFLWSREEIAKPLLENAKIEGKPRAYVLQVLGIPDLSEKMIYQQEDDATRNDTYQLSFLNTTSLDIEYDAKDIVKRFDFGPGCLPDYFPGPDSKGANHSIRKQVTSNLVLMKEGELEHLWGEPDQADIEVEPTFPTPLRASSYCWRVTPDGRVYNVARTLAAFNIPLDRRPIQMLKIVTLGPDCPVRRPSEMGIK